MPPDARFGPLPLHEWLHLALVYDASTVRVFVNGSRVIEYAGPDSVLRNNNPLNIGRSPYRRSTLNALVREVRISDVARYVEDFTPEWRFEPDEHAVVLLHCDEGEGDVAADASGRGNDANVVDAEWARH